MNAVIRYRDTQLYVRAVNVVNKPILGQRVIAWEYPSIEAAQKDLERMQDTWGLHIEEVNK